MRVPRLRLLTLVIVAVLVPAATARAADLAPGLSSADARAIHQLAGDRWPASRCGDVTFVSVPARLMRGLRVGLARGRRCTIMLNRGARLSATGWCRALAPAFAALARGTRASSWPYDCALAVGPRPTRPRLLTVPGLDAATVRRAYEVATAHWPSAPCRGREQLRWATPAQLGSQGEGLVTMGMARLRDPRCLVFLNDAVAPWSATELCHVIEHELGHLTGLKHVPRVDPVMAAVGGHAADCEAAFGADGAAPPPAPPDVVAPGGFGGLG